MTAARRLALAGALAFLVLPVEAHAQDGSTVAPPPVPDAAAPAPGDGTLEAEPGAPDRFVLDPAIAFEAFFAGNHARALDLAITFAGRGDAPSMRLLGEMYERGLAVEADPQEAAEWYRLAAQAGDAPAQVRLATMKLDGVLVPSEPEAAAALLRQASDAGNVQATQMLGMLTLEGRGVQRDIARGAQLTRQAAEAGDASAQYTLGILYLEGAGLRQDTRQAYTWIERAARTGNTEAQVELALGLLAGNAGEPDLADNMRIENALFWLRRGAEGGNPVAENRLAHAYAEGIGVPLDPVRAAYFHTRAVAGGLGDASLDAFVMSLSEAQRAEAQALIAADRAGGSAASPGGPAEPQQTQEPELPAGAAAQ